MDQNIKKNHPPAFKEKVALEAIKEAETTGQLASRFAIHPIQVGVWKKAAIPTIHQFFVSGNSKAKEEKEDEREELYKKIGKLEMENDFLKKRWECLRNMNNLTPYMIATQFIDSTDQKLSLTQQAELLGISRSSLYYQPVPVDPETLDLMHRIDKIHTDWPTYGARTIAAQLRRDTGLVVGRKRTRTLMENMGISAVYQKPHLSLNTTEHPVFPYLIKGVAAGYPNHIWGTDITYIRLHGGFVYLVAYIDWYSRYIVGWNLSTTLATPFVLEAGEKALTTYGNPKIMNSDQEVQFTSQEYINLWNPERTRISMDHKGRCFDNIFTERFWRTLKYDEVYLKDYQTVKEAETNIGDYIHRYNTIRLHESLGYKTPSEVYFAN